MPNVLTTDTDGYAYEYGALNETHAYRLLRQKTYGTCIALGCATGDDVAPLAENVDRFIAIEPAAKWAKKSIAGKPATYVAPALSGDLPVASGSAGLATSIGVLHHIPNVSHVIREVARALEPGGRFVIREPISSMGDWRKGRPGLTKNERGLPRAWLKATLADAGFEIERERLCMVNPLVIIAKKLGMEMPFTNRLFVAVDAVASTLLIWNNHYWRDTFVKKFAPGSVYLIARKICLPTSSGPPLTE